MLEEDSKREEVEKEWIEIKNRIGRTLEKMEGRGEEEYRERMMG